MAANGIVILGSATPPGRLRRMLEEGIARRSDSADDGLELLDLAERDVGLAGVATAAAGPDRSAALEAVASADFLVMATPVYRGSMSGVLKNFLDLVPVEALQGKPVGLVAMGASDHHFLGAERHLRDVLAYFGAVVAPVAVYANSQSLVDGQAGPELAADLDALMASVAAIADRLGNRDLGPVPLGAARGR